MVDCDFYVFNFDLVENSGASMYVCVFDILRLAVKESKCVKFYELNEIQFSINSPQIFIPWGSF